MESLPETKEIYNNWEDIIHQGKPYTDPDFPPTRDSIYDEFDFTVDADIKFYQTLKWKRASQLFKKPVIEENLVSYPNGYSLFPDNIDFEGVKSGLLNSSYFIASLAALCDGAKSPRIQKLFRFSQPNNAGIWVVQFCINGAWTDVIIDDHLPVDENGELVFTTIKPVELQGKDLRHILWAALLEKAWAKVLGSYDRILLGTTELAMIHLTGALTLGYKNQESEKETIWNQLIEAQKNHHIMSAATQSEIILTENFKQITMQTTDENFKKDCGLIPNHGYFIRSVYQADGDLRLVKLKNPQGDIKWNGDWNLESELWTDELREKTVDADVDVFFMTFDAYLKLFSDTYVCKLGVAADFHSLCQKTKNVPEVNWFKFSLEDEFKCGEYGLDIVIQQMGNRIYRHKRDSDGIEFENSTFQVTLVSVGGEKNVFEGITQQVHYIKSTISSEWQVYLQISPELLANQNCGTGKYLLGVEAFWNEKAPPKSEFRQFSVDIITYVPIEITSLKLDQSFCKQIMNQAYCNLAVQTQETAEKISKYENREGALRIMQRFYPNSIYGQVVVVNASNIAIHEKFVFENMDNFEFYHGGEFDGREGIQILVKVPFKSMMSIMLRRKTLAQEGSFKYKSIVIPGQGNVVSNTDLGLGKDRKVWPKVLGPPQDDNLLYLDMAQPKRKRSGSRSPRKSSKSRSTSRGRV